MNILIHRTGVKLTGRADSFNRGWDWNMICKQCRRPLGPMDIFCGECGTFIDRRDTVAAPRITPDNQDDQTILRPAVHNEVISDALEVTRIVRPGHKRGRQIELSFSTGGSVQIDGTGLLGRNPQPNLNEEFEHLVLFRDPSRTVSKTHLEFRVDDDGLWIKDRDSVNGSYLLNELHEDVRQFDSGQWAVIVDGSLIGIGDEHFLVRYLSADS